VKHRAGITIGDSKTEPEVGQVTAKRLKRAALAAYLVAAVLPAGPALADADADAQAFRAIMLQRLRRQTFPQYLTVLGNAAQLGQVAVSCGVRDEAWGRQYQAAVLDELQHHITDEDALPRPTNPDEAGQAIHALTELTSHPDSPQGPPAELCDRLKTDRGAALAGLDSHLAGKAPFAVPIRRSHEPEADARRSYVMTIEKALPDDFGQLGTQLATVAQCPELQAKVVSIQGDLRLLAGRLPDKDYADAALGKLAAATSALAADQSPPCDRFGSVLTVLTDKAMPFLHEAIDSLQPDAPWP
jgi:hypothetical protein